MIYFYDYERKLMEATPEVTARLLPQLQAGEISKDDFLWLLGDDTQEYSYSYQRDRQWQKSQPGRWRR